MTNPYQNKYLKVQNNQTLYLCIITKFVVLTPLMQGVENHTKWAQKGSILFIYIITMDI